MTEGTGAGQTELTDHQRELARLYRVDVEYQDWQGETHPVAAETILAVLAAFGVEAHTADEAVAALEEHRRRAEADPLPASVVICKGEAYDVPSGVTGIVVDLEDGGRIDVASSTEGAGAALPSDLPLGYHRLRAHGPEGGEVSAHLIVTPPYLGLPARLRDDRCWGFALQLYSVRSRASWGVGDLADLAELARWSATDLGADYVLVNPISASAPTPPLEPSPYLPASRSFVNPLYLRVEDVPEYDALPPADKERAARIRAGVHRALDDKDDIDRDTSWAAKAEVLRLVVREKRILEREAAYQAFRRREGRQLVDFATWSAIAQEHGPQWQVWPAELRHPASTAVERYRAEHDSDVDFYAWLQWLLDEQLATAQQAATDAGMRIGVMHDLPVGVHPSGADAWLLQDVFAQGVSVGAPPDAFSQQGQDWSPPPWRPDRLAELGYAPYRHLIARLLRHSGALRIDHVIGLFRLWCIPHGRPPDQGTYVRYDDKALVGILALEASRADAVVVGEDLGNVEPSAREYLAQRGIVGTSLLWFERDPDGNPLPPDQWRELSLASVTTHDLPPTALQLSGEHVDLRERLGLLTRPVEEERSAAAEERNSWLAALREHGLLSGDADEEATVEALHRFLALTPARLACVLLTDAVGDRRTQNQPGTSTEYPNWRIPLSGPDGEPLLLDDVEHNERVRRLAGALRSALEAHPPGTAAPPQRILSQWGHQSSRKPAGSGGPRLRSGR